MSKETIIAAVKSHVQADREVLPESRLVEDLNLDSMSLVQIIVQLHGDLGIDLGRRAAERQVSPYLVEDLIDLAEAA